MPALLRTVFWPVAAAIVLYCAGLAALAAAWALDIRGFWWLDLANIFALYLFIPLLALIPFAILWRGSVVRGAVLIGGAAFLVLFGPGFIAPAFSGSPGSGPQLRVVTFNLHSSRAARQVAMMIADIRAQRADVVMLQDLSGTDAVAIKQQLGREYPYQALKPAEERIGIGMISRYPLELQPQAGLVMQRALLRTPSRSITLINVSLTAPEIAPRYVRGIGSVPALGGYNAGNRSRDIGQLLRAIDGVGGPLILAGDFNLSDREREYRQFAARLRDGFRETNWRFGFTFPTNFSLRKTSIALPVIRIDYVWSGGGVAPVAARVDCGGESDHCMIIADLAIGDGAAGQ